MNAADQQVVATLEQRVAQLEQQVATLQAQPPAVNETTQANYLTVDASGHVSATFSGIISAQGVTLPTYSGLFGQQQPANQVAWVTPAQVKTGSVWANYTGSREQTNVVALPTASTDQSSVQMYALPSSGWGPGGAYLLADYRGNTDYAEVLASAFNGAGSQGASVFIVDSLGNSSFVQVANGPQNLQLACGETAGVAAGGAVTIDHGLPRTPVAVLASNQWGDNTSQAAWTVYGVGSTQFSAINKGPTAGGLAWLAIG